MKQAWLVVICILNLVPLGSLAQMQDTVDVIIRSSRFDDAIVEEVSHPLSQESQGGKTLVQNLGPGLLSTLRIQGLASRHTAIVWEGHNLQSALNGTSDLNLLPPSNLAVSYQSLSHIRGGVGLGGGLLIQNKVSERHVSLTGDSNRNSAIDIKHAFHNSNSVHSIQLNIINNDNKFRFINNGEAAFREHARLRGANIKSQHIFTISDIPIKLSTWFQNYDREIGPSKTSVYNGAIQEDRNLRLSLEIGKREKIQGTVAYLKEFIGFQEGSIDSRGGAHAMIAGLQWRGKKHHLISLYNRLDVSSTNFYERNHHRNLLDVSYRYKTEIASIGIIEGHLLQSFINDEIGPWSGLGRISKQFSYGLNLSIEIDKSYQLPTFNDLYWWDGGNPDLKTEQAHGYGLAAKYKNDKVESKIAFLQKHVRNWINWLPLDVNSFTPINHRSVRATTISWEVDYHISDQVKFSGGFYNTRTIILEDDRFNNLIGKQAIYVPKYRGNLGLLFKPSSWSIYLDSHFRSKLYASSDNTSSLPARYIQNVSFSKEGVLKNNEINISLGVYNLFNIDYEEVAFFPMPLRYYKIDFKINY